MTAAERTAIMDKAIRRALAGGWQIPFEEPITTITVDTGDVGDVPQLQPYVRIGLEGDSDFCIGIPGVLFDHDFARALWPENHCGKQEELNFDDHSRHIPHHLFHEEEMVIAEDPIAYLGSTLNGS